MRDPLSRRFVELCRSAGATDEVTTMELLEEILSRHAEPQRHHHTSEHVAEMLQTVAALADPALPAVDTRLAGEGAFHAVCFATWLHDVVYDPTSSTNEQDSADFAGERLGVLGLPPGLVEETQRLILLTRDHEIVAGDLNAMVLNDADLAILAARPKRYDRYSVAIRAEYGHLDDDAYRAGRRGVLESFLARGSIYGTEQMVNRCDAAARLNLSRELAAIGA